MLVFDVRPLYTDRMIRALAILRSETFINRGEDARGGPTRRQHCCPHRSSACELDGVVMVV
jgi:hypothetical protein